ncbi:hypothetical protein VPHD485_0259 [Vibrio phage D485]
MINLSLAIASEFTDKTDRVLPTDIVTRVNERVSKFGWNYYTAESKWLDTADRDVVFDFIAEELGFQDGWPLFGSSMEYTQSFFDKLSELEKADA